MKYYIAENGQPAGPFELRELLDHGLTSDSQVWNETLSGWMRASDVAEVQTLLEEQRLLRQQEQEAAAQRAAAARQAAEQAAAAQAAATPEANNGHLDPDHPENAYAPAGYNASSGEFAPQQAAPQQPPFAPQQPPYPPQQPYNPMQRYSQTVEAPASMPKDWKTENIVLTICCALCCCNIFGVVTGIIGIVQGNSVQQLFTSRQYDRAREQSSLAKKFFIATLVLWIIWSIGMVIYTITFELPDTPLNEIVLPNDEDSLIEEPTEDFRYAPENNNDPEAPDGNADDAAAPDDADVSVLDDVPN